MLSTGKHLVRISRSGYHDLEKMITLEETMEYPLVFQLKAVRESDERGIKPLRDRQEQ